MTKYDIPRLIEDADPEIVALSIGIPVEKRGNRTYILCPEHPDRNFGSCILTPHGYCCFACGSKGDVIAMAQRFLSVGFTGACEAVAETCGGAGLYLRNPESPSDFRCIPKKDADFIGLYTGPLYETVVLTESTEEFADLYETGEITAKRKITSNALGSLSRESPKMYRQLIADKCEETAELYLSMLRAFSGPGALDERMRNSLGEIIAETERISLEHAPGETKKSLSRAKREVSRNGTAKYLNKKWDEWAKTENPPF